VLGAVLAYALLLNALVSASVAVQAVAAALDPLAATCETPASDPSEHKDHHQPDCMLCSPAAPIGGMAQAPGCDAAVAVPPTASRGLDANIRQSSGAHPPSVYFSDSFAQAPPAIG